MIASGEAPDLERAVDSVRGVISEIVVADTGLAPSAREVLSARGARVVPFAWRDDFSAARNTALDAGTSDWILSLDADEWVEDAASLARLAAGAADGYVLETANFVRYEDATTVPSPAAWNAPAPFWFPSSKIRLWRRAGGVRWEGAVHEVLDFAAKRAGLRVERGAVRVLHDGLLAAHTRNDRYLVIARGAYERGEATPPILLVLGQEREATGDLEAAERLLGEALRIENAYPAAIVALARIFRKTGRSKNAGALLLAGVKETGADASVLYEAIGALGPAGEALREVGRRLYPGDPRFATLVA